jgi:hypothetical protein
MGWTMSQSASTDTGISDVCGEDAEGEPRELRLIAKMWRPFCLGIDSGR